MVARHAVSESDRMMARPESYADTILASSQGRHGRTGSALTASCRMMEGFLHLIH